MREAKTASALNHQNNHYFTSWSGGCSVYRHRVYISKTLRVLNETASDYRNAEGVVIQVASAILQLTMQALSRDISPKICESDGILKVLDFGLQN